MNYQPLLCPICDGPMMIGFRCHVCHQMVCHKCLDVLETPLPQICVKCKLEAEKTEVQS